MTHAHARSVGSPCSSRDRRPPVRGAESTGAGRSRGRLARDAAPSWFEQSTAPPHITAYGMLYAITMRCSVRCPVTRSRSLADRGSDSADGELRVSGSGRGSGSQRRSDSPPDRREVRFERYRGPARAFLQERVQQVGSSSPDRAIPPPRAVPDFLTFYGRPLRRGHRRAEALRDARRRRRLPEASDRRRAVSVRPPHSGRRVVLEPPRLLAARGTSAASAMKSVPDVTTRVAR